MAAENDTLGTVDSLLRKVAAVPERQPPPALSAGTVVAGAFRIERRLGSGGMGVVYLARDQRLARDVALKLHVGSDEGLLAEARVTARLAHPNVVTVYEVGTFEGRVFLAMEHLAGGTLRRWLEERPRPWDEILDRFLEAGRGLAAAHGAGLVHRDFKPENVLLGDDGRARVADFGLARSHRSDDAPAAAVGSGPAPAGSGTAPAGTPGYMSPEQLAGRPADARSDQYSFCVALREALAEKRHPGWLRRAVARGLEQDPARRWPSMSALTARIQAGRRRRRRIILLAGVASVAVAAAGVTWRARDDRAQVCSGARDHLAGVWDTPRRAALGAALAAALGPAQAESTIRDLDAYADGWANEHREACLATEARHEQSQRLLHARMACLDRALAQLSATVELATESADERSLRAVAGLPAVGRCGDTAALAGLAPEPEDPAFRDEAKAIRAELGRLAALWSLGRTSELLEPYGALVDRARRLGYAPLLANVLCDLSWVEEIKSRAESKRQAEDGFLAAVAGGSDEYAVRALLRLVSISSDESSADQTSKLLDLASAFLSRHPDEDLEIRVAEARAFSHRARGRYADAVTEMSRAVERQRKLSGGGLRMVEMLNSLAFVQFAAGHFDAALVSLDEAILIVERIGGPDDSAAIYAHVMRANTHRILGSYERAENELVAVLPHCARRYGQDDRNCRSAQRRLAHVQGSRGNFDGAISTLERTLQQEERAADSSPTAIPATLALLADQYAAKGNLDRALDYDERALAAYQNVVRPEERELLDVRVDIGILQRRLGRIEESAATLADTYLMEVRALPEDHPARARGAVELAMTRLLQKRAGEAIELLEPIVPILARPGMPPDDLAGARFTLARSLWDSHRDRTRARALAEQARDAYIGLGRDFTAQRDEVSAWLAKHH